MNNNFLSKGTARKGYGSKTRADNAAKKSAKDIVDKTPMVVAVDFGTANSCVGVNEGIL